MIDSKGATGDYKQKEKEEGTEAGVGVTTGKSAGRRDGVARLPAS